MWFVFKTFFILGCISFGGPAAHIAYFRETFVQRLSWLSERQYAEFVALSQFLPGPGSSQVGFAIGYHRAGLKGAISAFLGFTLPSILIMLVLVISAGQLADNTLFASVVHTLKLLAVVVVFDAVLIMYRNFCKETSSIFVCLFTACILLVFPSILSQIVVLVFAAVIGLLFLKATKLESPKKKRHCLIKSSFTCINYIPLLLFLALLLIPNLLFSLSPFFSVFSDFFHAGSLVFGGGHVVLPILQGMLTEQVTSDQFLSGYAIAQAVPGPMFTLATYLGYFILPNTPIAGALIATIAIFLPGFLLLLSCLKHWGRLAKNPCLAAVMNGVNAAVVGLLVTALYQPVFTSSVFSGLDMALVLIGFYLLKRQKLPVLYLVLTFAVFGVILNFI
ncbi:chromate efflux transporter [Psychromonas aquatilis]|uniref:Chromate efflux transporter n=1 Tax=Psychromonas aquatilis TaxID=2005072 RepID=A0ABU9GL26_9GAMM